jgi:hypothetical protein
MGSRNRGLVVSLAALIIGLGSVAPAATTVRAASVLHVPADYATIQGAIDAAADGDTVVVAAGTYAESINLSKSITVEGAGAGVTTIDGVGGDPTVSLYTQQTVTPAIRGFTITGGSSTFGGGVYLVGQGSATITDNVITGNYAGGGGGGIDINGGGSSLIERNRITSNNGQYGGGIEIINAMTPVIRNNLVAGNAASSGGGLSLSVPYGSTGPSIVNNTWVDNTASSGPGWRFIGFASTTVVRNNVVSGSTSQPTVFCDATYSSVAPILQSNDIFNAGGDEYAGSCAGTTGTAGNVSVDPGYADPSHGNYHLRPDSVLIDAGADDVTVATDIDGDARPFDGDEDGVAEYDIGWDESTDPLLIDPGSLSFSDTPLGGTSSGLSVTLSNFGGSSLAITTATLGGANDGDFAKTADTCTGATLSVHASCVVTVTFSPSAAGARAATITVTGPGAVGTRTIQLAGTGLDPFSITSSVDFGGVPLASVATPKPASLTNYGSVPATVSSVSISGTDAADFSIVSEDCTAGPVPVAQGCALSIGFTPHGLGARAATLTLSGPFPVGTRNIALTGTGTAPLSGVSWGTTYSAGPSYSWNEGYGLARSVQGTTQRLHALYATDRVSGTWARDGGPYLGVYYTKSSSGSSWTTGKRLNPTTQHAARLGIAAYGSRVYATWVSQTKLIPSSTGARVLYVRVNTNYGDAASWKTAIRLTSTTGRVDYPTIAVSGYDAYIAWTDSATGSVKVAISHDRGVTWKTTSLGSTTAGNSSNKYGYPTVAVASSTVAVTWVSANTGTIRTRISTNRGSTWGTTDTVAASSNWSFGTAVRSNRVAVTWTGPDGVALAQRIAGIWQAPVVVAPGDGVHEQYTPTVVLQDPNRVGIAWAEDAAAAYWSNLRWAESADGGATWFAAQTIGSSTGSGARRANDFPSVVWPSASTRYIVWNGWTSNTNYYRLYTRKGTGTPVGVTTAAQPLPTDGGARQPAGTDGGVRRAPERSDH